MSKITKCFADTIYKDYAENVCVYLPNSKTKSASYDPFRDVGYIETNLNYMTVKAIIRDAKPEELIMKNIGLVYSGAKKLVIKDSDVALVKISNKITIDSVEYYVYNDAVGNKFQILGQQFGYSTVMIFRKEI